MKQSAIRFQFSKRRSKKTPVVVSLTNKVTRTPTAIYFDSKVKEKKRVPIAGKSWSDIQKYLGRLAGKKPSAGATRPPKRHRQHGIRKRYMVTTSHGHPA